jgi:hypothetical protein
MPVNGITLYLIVLDADSDFRTDHFVIRSKIIQLQRNSTLSLPIRALISERIVSRGRADIGGMAAN